MPRNLIANALQRVHDTTLTNTVIDVFEPTVSYTAGDGFEVDYPETASDSYDARIDGQNRVGEKERGGTTADIDAMIRVRDDHTQQWVGYGKDGEAELRVVDTTTDVAYAVESVSEPEGGLLTLRVTER